MLSFSERFRDDALIRRIFKDQSKLSPDYVPKELLHRDDEFRELTRCFRPVLESGGSQRVLITGEVGVGKTVLARRFGRELESKAWDAGLDLTYVHVNCRARRSPQSVLEKVCEELPYAGPLSRGEAPQEIMGELVGSLREGDMFLTVGLDELDDFVKRSGADLLYTLSRPSDGSDNRARVSVIATSFSRSFLDSLDEATRSSFMHNVVKLDRYGEEQLSDILNQRVELAFQPGVVRRNSLDLISDIASGRGDARFALELLWCAGRIAADRKLKNVSPEHVRGAKARLKPEIEKSTVQELEQHGLLLFLAVSKHLKVNEAAYVTEDDAYGRYRTVCEEHGERPKGRGEVKSLIRKLQTDGVVDVETAPEETGGGGARMGISEPSAEMIEDELEKILKLDHREGGGT